MPEDKRFNHNTMAGSDPNHFYKLRYTSRGLTLCIVSRDGRVIPGGNVLHITDNGYLKLCETITTNQNLIKLHPTTHRILMHDEEPRIKPAKNIPQKDSMLEGREKSLSGISMYQEELLRSLEESDPMEMPEPGVDLPFENSTPTAEEVERMNRQFMESRRAHMMRRTINRVRARDEQAESAEWRPIITRQSEIEVGRWFSSDESAEDTNDE